jgi:SAM-dependent methyltransferase
MTQNPAASEWAAARGEKWRAGLLGMEPTLAPVDEPLIGALRLDAPARIADIGCGGGGTTLEIFRRAPAGSVVHGFDVSPALIESARARIRAGQRDLAFTLADVSKAPAPEPRYDRLVSRFGIMFYDDPSVAFANLIGWLTPGGRFAFAVWGRQADNPWFVTIRDVVAEVIELPRPDPKGPGPFRYAEADALTALLADAGFTDVAVRDWRGALPIGGGLPAAEAASFGLASFSSFGELLAEAGPAAFDRARQSLTARLSSHEHDGVVRIDACVHIVTGGRG